MAMNKALQKHILERILKKHGIESDKVDLEAEIDSNLTLRENIDNILKKYGISVNDQEIDQEIENAKYDDILEDYMRMNGIDIDQIQEQIQEEQKVHLEQIQQNFAEIVAMDPLALSKFVATELIGEQYEFVRKAVLLCICSEDNRSKRGRIHVLVYGPPGCGKTEILLWLRRVVGAYFVNAEYASRVGLAGDARGIEVTPGALAEAHGGIIAIDELDKMNHKDQSALLQAMEEGAYTIIKGKHRVRFDAEVRVVATANDISKIQKPLLDRFDFVIQLNNLSKDERAKNVGKLVDQFFLEDKRVDDYIIREYLAWLSDAPTPQLEDPDTTKKLLEDYIKLTQSDISEKSVRSLELSIMRIANTLARMAKTNVTPMHVLKAITLKDRELSDTQIRYLIAIAKKML
jgi:DNA replicative helicase MCM subunit Mcm2 (Cdc46/Mcm family)